MYELYLVHSGILGMKWGVRRFQNEDGTLTTAGKARYGAKGSAPRHKPSNARKLAKQRAANLEKARQAKAAKAAHETAKKNAIEKGSAEEVMKFKTELSNKELQDVVNRLRLESQLSDFLPKEEVKTKSKNLVDKVVDVADKTRSNVEKGINIWNTIVKIHNSFSSDKWQPIGGDSVAEARQKKADEKKEKAEKASKLAKINNALKGGAITHQQYLKYKTLLDSMSPADIDHLLKNNLIT